MMKRIFSLLLCLALIACMFPATVLAEDGESISLEQLAELDGGTENPETVEEQQEEQPEEQQNEQPEEQQNEQPAEQLPVPSNPSAWQAEEGPVWLPEGSGEIQELNLEEQPDWSLPVPQQLATVLEHDNSRIYLTDYLNLYGASLSKYRLTDGSDIYLTVKEKVFEEEFNEEIERNVEKTVKELHEEQGYAYASSADGAGQFYIILVPADGYYFRDGGFYTGHACSDLGAIIPYVIYDFSVYQKVEEPAEEPAESYEEEIASEETEESEIPAEAENADVVDEQEEEALEQLEEADELDEILVASNLEAPAETIEKPVQNERFISYFSGDVDLRDFITFPAGRTAYVISNGSDCMRNEEQTWAEYYAAKPEFKSASSTMCVVSAEGKYYLIVRTRDGYTYEDGTDAVAFEFTLESKYLIVEGDNGEWIVGSTDEGLVFKSNGDYEQFDGIEIERIINENTGETESVTAEESTDYSSWSGSTYVKVYKEFLEKLKLKDPDSPETKFILKLKFSSGKYFATGHFKITDKSKAPKLATVAKCVDTGTRTVPAGINAEIQDDVFYCNLKKGTKYDLVGALVYADTGNPVLGSDNLPITATSTFTAKESHDLGSEKVEVHFKFDSTGLDGKAIVVTQMLYTHDTNSFVEKHDDLTDAKQTVYVASLKTVATVNGTAFANADEEITITDAAAYTGLTKGEKYTIITTVAITETGLLLEDDKGDPITSKKEFTAADESGGTVSASIKFTPSDWNLAGSCVTVFEKIVDKNGKEIIVHEDTSDIMQTIVIPKIVTSAAVGGYSEALAASETTITDRVEYSNLIKSESYQLEGELMLLHDDATYEPIPSSMGGPVTASTSFTSSKDSGHAEVKFQFDASKLAGETVVVFEELRYGGKLIGEHKDPSDKKQIISFPKITTKLLDNNGNPVIYSGQETTLYDTIKCTNLTPGEKYRLTAVLIDGATGNPAHDSFGNPIEAQAEFKASGTGEASVDLKFKFDADPFIGTSLTSYVTLINLDEGERTVGEHKDISSLSQTVFIPFITTSADNGNGSKELFATETSPIVDTVHYTALRPKMEYTLKASVYNKSTGIQVKLADGSYESELKFFPTASSGTVKNTMAVDATKYVGLDLVVTETLYCGKTMVALHNNLEDEDQTVSVSVKPAVYKRNASTGNPLPGAVIRITDMTTGNHADVTTDTDGIAYFPLINGHQYSYVEITPPAGYKLNPNTYYFSVDKSGSVNKDDQILLNQKTGTVVITKTDVKTGAPVPGAQITVYDSKGTTLFTQTTDKHGQIYFDAMSYIPAENIVDGKFKVTFKFKEVSAPTGYYLDSTTYSFTVDQNGTVTGHTTITNCPTGTVMITKTDTDGHPLAGARISIYSSAGKLIGQATTNSAGHIYFSAPEAGSYYFIEDVAPSGFVRVDQKFAFALDKYGHITGTTSFVNQKGSDSNGVATGDNSRIGLFVGIGVLALGALTAVALTTAKKKKNGDSK